MEVIESVRIIEEMLEESKKSLTKNSFFFILWAVMLIPAGILESYFYGQGNFWLVWPIAGGLGGIIAFGYGLRIGKKQQVKTAADRISIFTWASFGLCMIFAMFYSVKIKEPPHALILMLSGGATFINGGISKFKPFILGGLFLIVAAALCAFLIEPKFQGYIFAVGLFIGYLVPGLILRKIEHG